MELYREWVLYQQMLQKFMGVGTGCMYSICVCESMQPEHKMPKITGTVLKPIKLLCRHHICSSWFRDKPRDVH